MEFPDHLVREAAEGQDMVRDGPADLMKGWDGEGFAEQFEAHRLPDRFALFAVELLFDKYFLLLFSPSAFP